MTIRSLIPFFVAVAGVGLAFWVFATGISAALNGDGSGSLVWQVIFVLAVIAVIGTVVLSIIKLIRKQDIVIAVATLFVAVVPIVIVLIVVIAAAAG